MAGRLRSLQHRIRAHWTARNSPLRILSARRKLQVDPAFLRDLSCTGRNPRRDEQATCTYSNGYELRRLSNNVVMADRSLRPPQCELDMHLLPQRRHLRGEGPQACHVLEPLWDLPQYRQLAQGGLRSRRNHGKLQQLPEWRDRRRKTRRPPARLESLRGLLLSRCSWANLQFDHSAVSGNCSSCHNGSSATGKPSGHIQSSNSCDRSHSPGAWGNVDFDHSAVSGSCFTCQNGVTQEGKPSYHIQTTNSCDRCHSRNSWERVRLDHDQITGSCNVCH